MPKLQIPSKKITHKMYVRTFKINVSSCDWRFGNLNPFWKITIVFEPCNFIFNRCTLYTRVCPKSPAKHSRRTVETNVDLFSNNNNSNHVCFRVLMRPARLEMCQRIKDIRLSKTVTSTRWLWQGDVLFWAQL